MFPSRIAANRILVRTFTTIASRRSSHLLQASILATSSRTSATVATLCIPEQQVRWKSTTQAIEDDDDDELEKLLEGAIQERDATTLGAAIEEEEEKSTKKTKTVEDDEEKFDPNDPKCQSTSNPRWVKAGLSQKVIDVLSGKGITHLTPVQAEAFDPVMAGRDLIGRSRTGTGKTLAFGIPAATRLVEIAKSKGFVNTKTGRMVKGRPVSMIVLCPTRELARQVQDELSSICRPLGLFTEVFHGGVSYDPQVCILSRRRGER